MKLLLIISAALEAPVGVLLLFLPDFAFSVLLGVSVDTPSGLVAARLAGAAIVTLAVACWQASNSAAAVAVATAMLCYNIAATAVLAYAGIRFGMSSIFLWPVIVLHSALAVWCVLSVWIARKKVANIALEDNKWDQD